MNCSNCGAPLAAKSNICRYCGTVNDTDLRGIRREIRVGPQGDRSCPRCDIKMNTIDLGAEGCVIDRCAECMGIFFDPEELESLTTASVSQVQGIDRARMIRLIEEEGAAERKVRYVKCPVCLKLMNRRNYGSLSGVVVDTCKEHGVWLDGGELGRILKWAKAGGLLHAAQRREEGQRAEERKLKEGTLELNYDDHWLPWGSVWALYCAFG